MSSLELNKSLQDVNSTFLATWYWIYINITLRARHCTVYSTVQLTWTLHTFHWQSPSAIIFSTKAFSANGKNTETCGTGGPSMGRGRISGSFPNCKLLKILEFGFVQGRRSFGGAVAIGEMHASEGTSRFTRFVDTNLSFRETCREVESSLIFPNTLYPGNNGHYRCIGSN